MTGRFAAGALTGVVAVLLTALAPFALLAGPAQAGTEPFTVTGAQLRWGINHESNNRAFAPGTYNFFSAGVVPDPGRGGTTLARESWLAESGNVRIEKQQADGSHATATWAGLTTAPDGTAIASPTSGRFTDHQVVVSNGTGTVDPATGFADITWQGSFTVLYYSGMSFFTVTDPTLSVTPERAQLTATLGGFASDMDDQSQWAALTPTRVVLADLPRTEVDLTSADGFASTPSYLGVGWTPPPGEPAQVGGPWKGAFPASFLDFLATAGTAGYWYSSGGATDAWKAALPLVVSWTGAPVATPTASVPTTPTKSATAKPTRSPTRTAEPSATATPTAGPTADATGSTPAPTTRTPTEPVAGPSGPSSSDGDSGALPAVLAAPVAVQPVLVSATPQPPTTVAPAAGDTESHALWLLGCVLLLGALAITLVGTSLAGTPVEGKQ